MSSIKDVAKRAGVSIATVSHVLRGTKAVSKELQERVEAAVKELDYHINPFASNLKSRRSKTIGVLVTNMNRIFFPQVIKGINDYFSKHDYSLMIYDTDDNLSTEKKFVQILKNNWVDGIILDTVGDCEKDADYFQELSNLGSKSKKIPVVSIERQLNGCSLDSVSVDNYRGAQIATQHLIDCGCSKIAHISGPKGSCVSHDRLQGFKDKLKSASLDRVVSYGDFSPLSGYQVMKELLLKGQDIDGVFAANDQMAIGTIKAICEHGLRIPEDIKVVGYDNTFVASIVSPSLSTVNVPKFQLGMSAAVLLMERIENPASKVSNVELPIQLIVRQSSDSKGDNTWELFGW